MSRLVLQGMDSESWFAFYLKGINLERISRFSQRLGDSSTVLKITPEKYYFYFSERDLNTNDPMVTENISELHGVMDSFGV